MAKKGRVQVKLRSSESAYMYVTTKNPKKHPAHGAAEVRSDAQAPRELQGREVVVAALWM